MMTHSLNDVDIVNHSTNYYFYLSNETTYLGVGILRIKRLFVACRMLFHLFIQVFDLFTHLEETSYKSMPWLFFLPHYFLQPFNKILLSLEFSLRALSFLQSVLHKFFSHSSCVLLQVRVSIIFSIQISTFYSFYISPTMSSPTYSQSRSIKQTESQTQVNFQEIMSFEQNMSFSAWFSKSIISDIPSRLGTNNLHHLRVNYNIPSDVVLIVPRCFDRASSVKLSQFYFYEKFLEVRVKFPIHPFIYRVLSHFKIAPRQLMPNSYRFLLIHIILSKVLDLSFPLNLKYAYIFTFLKTQGISSGSRFTTRKIHLSHFWCPNQRQELEG